MGTTDSKEFERSRQQAIPKPTDITLVLRSMRKQQTRPKNVLTVDRNSLLQTALSYLKTPDVEYSPLEVIMQTDGVTEEALDLGGPIREFFTLLYKEVLQKKLDMFEGQSSGRCLLPVNNDAALTGNLFYYLGKAIVISLCGTGPGFPYLAPYVVSYIRGEDYMHQLNISLVYNLELRQFIKKINKATSNEELIDILDGDTERFTDNCGWPKNQMITMKDSLLFSQTLLKWELVGKRVAALDQLKKGLNTLSFLDRTVGNPEVEEILIHKNTEKITAAYLKENLSREVNNLQPETENEIQAKANTLACLDMMTDQEATSLFHFITGMSHLPVEEIPIEVEFNHVNKEAELPEAVTCIQRLRIPLGNSSRMSFYSSIHKALSMGKYGFGGSEEV